MWTSSSAVVLLCLTVLSGLTVACQHGDIRLVGLWSSSREGTVEVCLNGVWGTVCDDSWEGVDANVVCRQLGYSASNAIAYYSASAYFGQGTGPILLGDLGCSGSEQMFIDCANNYTHNCGQYEDAGVRCQLATCQNGDLRLEGGTSSLEGRVEVCLNGVWGTVCGNNSHWSSVDANVVCRQLGHAGLYATAFSNASIFGQGTGTIFRDNVACSGPEERLIDCPYSSHVADCSHSDDAGVLCQPSTCQNGDLRLVNGTSSLEGRVEVCLNGVWGTVSDDSWEDVDANVVCRQLGYSDSNAVAYSYAYFGEGTGPIFLDNVGCSGSEWRLIDCGYDSNTAEDYHYEDAGVRCQLAICQDGDLRLVNGTSSLEGRVEVCLNGRWGSVCDDSWSSVDANVVCRQLGHASLCAIAYTGANFGQGTGPIFLDDVQCSGSEQKLINCGYDSITDCSHKEDAGVRCQPSLPGPPQNVRFNTNTATSLTLSWQHPAHSPLTCHVISGYRVSCPAAGVRSTTSNSTLFTTIQSLHPSTTYNCCVSTILTVGSKRSRCTSGRTTEASPSGPPQSVQGTATSSTTLHISWTPPPSSQRNGIIQEYQIQFREQDSSNVFYRTTSSTAWTEYSLHPYYSYEIHVAAKTVSYGPFSNIIIVQMPEAVPSASPQDLAWSTPNPQTLYLTWSLPPPEHRNGVIREYRINITERETGRFEQLTSQQATIMVYSLKGFHNYSVLVAAVTIGTGPYTEELNLQMPQDVPAEAPEILNIARVSATSIHVMLRPLTVEESRGIVTSYHIRYREDSCSDFISGHWHRTLRHHDFTVTGLDPRVPYCLAVAASTVAGVGDYSETTVVGLYSNSPFQILFSASVYCVEWLEFRREDKVADIVSDVTTVLRERCNCSITADYIGDGRLLCSTNNSVTVTLQARLISTDEVNSTQLLSHLEDWISTAPSITVVGERLQVSVCSVRPDSEETECTPPTTESDPESTVLVVLLVFAIIAVILLAFLLAFLVVTGTAFLYRKSSKNVVREIQERPDEYQDRPPTFSLPWETHAALQRMVEAPDRESESESEKCVEEKPPAVPPREYEDDEEFKPPAVPPREYEDNEEFRPPPVPQRLYLEDEDSKAFPIIATRRQRKYPKAGTRQNQKAIPLQQGFSNAIQGENTNQEGPTHSAYSLLQTHKPSQKHAEAAFEMQELAHKAATAAAQRGKAQEEHIYQPLIPKRMQSLGQNPDHHEYQSLTTRQQQ